MNKRPELLQVAVAIGVLAIGVLVYLLDRQPGSVYFIPDWISLANNLSPIFGQIGHHLPTFVHVYVFILLTTAVIALPLARLSAICFMWFAVDSLFEIAQITTIAQWIAGIVPAWFVGLPFLENTASYFLTGTFDVLDLVSIAAGAMAAYLTIVINSGRAHHQQTTCVGLRRPKHGYTFVLVVALGFVSTVGSGGGGGDGVTPIVYNGNTDPAVISPGNAAALVAGVIGDGGTTYSNNIPRAASIVSSDQAFIGSTDMVNRLHHALKQIPVNVNSGTMSSYITIAAISVDESVACTDGGSFSLSGNLNDDGTGVLNVSYNACREGELTLSGSGTFRIDIFDFGYMEITDGTMSFPRLTMSGSGIDITLSGTFRLELFIPSNIERSTMNGVYQDNFSGHMGMAENYITEITYDNWFSPTSKSTSISGRLYDSVHGYVDITTPTALSYSDLLIEIPDANSQLLFTGASNAKVLMTMLVEAIALLELDLDNDTVYEVSGELPWDVLSVAGTNPNDSDGDGIPDDWEALYGLSNQTYVDSSDDDDGDGLTNYVEYITNTLPNNSDTDSDGMPDGWELDYGFVPTDPLDAIEDEDGDGASNLDEYLAGTDPTDASSTPADLSIIKSDPIDPASIGTNFSYVLEVTNNGPGIASNIEVIDTLPVNTSFYSATGDRWGCTHLSGSVTCTRGSFPADIIPVGTTSEINIVTTAPAGIDNLLNSASVSSDTPDLVPVNNYSSVTTQLADPILTFVEAQIDDVGIIPDALNSQRSVTISPDGKHVYTTRFPDDAISVFSRDIVTGGLSFVEIQQDGVNGVDGLDGVNAATVSGDGAHVYAVSGFDNALAVFSRNITTGALTFVEAHKEGVNGVTGLQFASTITVSPDGANVYATGASLEGSDQWAVTVFARNASTGLLTFVEVLRNGIDGVNIGWQPKGTISPDGAHFYVATIHENLGSDGTVSLFSRDASTGLLTFVDVYVDGTNGITGIDSASSISVSPDGSNIYVTGTTSFATGKGTVATFSRDSTTGELTFVDVHVDEASGIFGIGGASSISVSPSGNYVYITGSGDNTLALFERNSADGILQLEEVQTDNLNGVDGLDSAYSVVASPDGQHIYITGLYHYGHTEPGDKSVAVFSVNPRSAP